MTEHDAPKPEVHADLSDLCQQWYAAIEEFAATDYQPGSVSPQDALELDDRHVVALDKADDLAPIIAWAQATTLYEVACKLEVVAFALDLNISRPPRHGINVPSHEAKMAWDGLRAALATVKRLAN